MVKVGDDIRFLKDDGEIKKGDIFKVDKITNYNNSQSLAISNAAKLSLTWSHLEGTDYEICHVAASNALADTFRKPDPAPTTEFAGSHNLPIDLDWDDYER